MKNNLLSIQKVLIDDEFIDIPVAVFNKHKRKTILITAGIDGDEYSGIKAAFEIIKNFKKYKCDYRVIIIPLLNVFGNKEGVSFNPKDGKYPKNIYPGKPNGSSSEQLIHYLDSFIKKSFIWIDLHSGSKDEILKPFIWTWETKNKRVNNLIVSVLSNFQEDLIVFQKKSTWKVELLAKENIAYIMLESGELGEEDSKYVNKHINWVKKILKNDINNKKILVYRSVKFDKANKSGEWDRKISPGNFINNDIAGNIDGKKIFSDGVVLYVKKSKTVNRGEELFATASNEKIV